MKKILQSILMLILVTGAAQAQFTPFNRVINVNLNRGASPTNDTTAMGAASKYYESPQGTSSAILGMFFPVPPASGDYRLRALSYGPTAEFKLAGNVVSMKNATTNPLSKIAVFGISNPNTIAKLSFTLDLTSFVGDSYNSVVVAFGNNGITGTTPNPGLISSSNPYANYGDCFGVFRVNKTASSAGVFLTQYKDATGTEVNATANLITAGASQTVEIFVNNSNAPIDYKYQPADVNTVTLAAGTYHVYINGVKHVENFAKLSTFPAPAATNSEINTVSVSLTGNTAVQETVKLSNLQVTYQAATLPVSLTSFTGEKAINGIRLNWKTASELNNDHFDVLRSTDGQTFTTLTSVTGNGTSATANSYSYLDNAPANGTNYYKLKQVDKDGTAVTSDIVVAVESNLASEQALTLSVAGNTLNASFDASTNGKASISIHDLSGRSVFNKSFSVQKGANNVSISVPAFNTGIYVATLTQNGKSKSIKFAK